MQFHKKLIDYFINLILWILLIIFILPVLFLLFVWKWTVVLVAKLFHSNLHSTDPNDTYFAIDDASANGIPIVNAAQIWKIKGKVCIHEFRKHFHACFLSDDTSRTKYLNFYCYLEKFGGYVFKKSVDEIDLEKQILERRLPPGTNLEAWITKWFVEEKFMENSPLWQIVLLQIPFTCNTEECETVLLLKNHHCLGNKIYARIMHFI